ncbi:phospholipid methyltransferase [Methylobacterium variabile]|jgi:ubiquinone/menaquinone biosynthesis C-methylase UbiE|uniref:Phospholipid methyltransferase n=1 Tax=Methylobacterium variabile TaxID=298794 RepID=A0A0J6TAX7_9HYPH|nr:class I SAM-dependent methyltransferase [Methylobacterium variabile]KMO43007.1 phospholipid methyltransferase [Methylobacterium variabile]
MGFYGDRILPWLVDRVMANKDLLGYRTRVVGAARGRVLEIGIGSGLNLPFYGPDVTDVLGIEPSQGLIDKAASRSSRSRRRISFLHASAEVIPLETRSVDTVVTTWALCSIPDIEGALREMRRVLKPGGELLFAEHGQAPDRWVARWQDCLTPGWKPIAGGCHLNRPIAGLIQEAGFRTTDLRTGYAPGPRPFTFMYEGRAVPA